MRKQKLLPIQSESVLMRNKKLRIEATECHGIQKRRGEGNRCEVGYQTMSPRKLKSP